MFSGEEYKDYSQPVLSENCIFKVCSCKKGFKDSNIITFKFYVNKDIKVDLEEVQLGKEANVDVIIKGKDQIDTVRGLTLIVAKSSPLDREQKDSPNDLNRPGTSKYEVMYYNDKEQEEEEDEDGI